MKGKHSLSKFLHAHPHTASSVNLDMNHVIIDKADWLWVRKNKAKVLAAPEMLEALIEISEGKGRYDLDPIQHAANCIEDMKALALEAIQKATP